MPPEKFPEQPLYPVAPHCPPYPAAHHQSQAGVLAGGFRQADPEVAGRKPLTPGLGLEKFLPTAKPICLGETGFPFGEGGAGDRGRRAGP